nr:Ycf17 [Erythrocladia irregularis]
MIIDYNIITTLLRENLKNTSMNQKENKRIELGFTNNSEKCNGRLAMISFIIIIIIEIIKSEPILQILNF